MNAHGNTKKMKKIKFSDKQRALIVGIVGIILLLGGTSMIFLRGTEEVSIAIGMLYVGFFSTLIASVYLIHFMKKK